MKKKTQKKHFKQLLNHENEVNKIRVMNPVTCLQHATCQYRVY